MNFIKKNIWWLGILFCLLVFGLLAVCVHFDKFQNFDTEIHDIILMIDFPLVSGFWMVITTLANPIFIILLLIILLLIINNKKYGLLMVFNTINILFLNQILKLLFSRPRPFELMLIEETGYSFPSGHAMLSLAFYGFLIYIVWKVNLSKMVKKILTAFLIILILLIGVSRIYLGVHYPSDILGGFAISLVYLIIFIKLVKKYDVGSDKVEKSLQ